MIGIAWNAAGAARIGASTSIGAIAGDARLAAAYPGVAAAAGGLATPQIRRVATLGGNLAQRSRCWYFRNPQIDCLKKGGTACPAREGNHLYGVAFDLGPCVAPHPSTMAAALLAYDATARTNLRPALTIEQLLGDGSNGAADHALLPGEMIESVELPPPLAGERAAYKRAIGRAAAEWPLVEVVARVVVERRRVWACAPRCRRRRAGSDPPRRRRSRSARGARLARDHRRCGARRDRGRQALADDRLQARALVRPRAGSSGAVHGLSAMPRFSRQAQASAPPLRPTAGAPRRPAPGACEPCPRSPPARSRDCRR